MKDLQDIFGFATPQAIYKWQKGAAMPTIDNLVVLAMVFRVKMDDIIVVDAAADLMDALSWMRTGRKMRSCSRRHFTKRRTWIRSCMIHRMGKCSACRMG